MRMGGPRWSRGYQCSGGEGHTHGDPIPPGSLVQDGQTLGAQSGPLSMGWAVLLLPASRVSLGPLGSGSRAEHRWGWDLSRGHE